MSPILIARRYAGILVEAEGVGGANPGGSGRARTDDDGSYTMELPPEQSYMVYVVDAEWAARSLNGVVLREGKARSGLDLRLERERDHGTCHGRPPIAAGGQPAGHARGAGTGRPAGNAQGPTRRR